jgi:hypothetical protein
MVPCWRRLDGEVTLIEEPIIRATRLAHLETGVVTGFAKVIGTK